MSTPPGAAEPLPVTVLIPALDREDLIRRAIFSAQTQLPAAPAQILVVDDGSTDRTAEVAAAMGADVVRHERNRGLSAARNTGMLEAAHDWVALLDSDDEFLPDHLHWLWEARNGHVFVADAALWISSHKRLWHGLCAAEPRTLTSPSELFFPQNYVPSSATLLRRDVALDAGGYDEELKKVEDLDMLVRLLERGTGLVLPLPGVLYHSHGEQMTDDRGSMREVHAEVIARYADREWWDARVAADFEAAQLWDDARAALRGGEVPAALGGMGRIAVSPARLRAVSSLLRWRRQGRRMLRESPGGL